MGKYFQQEDLGYGKRKRDMDNKYVKLTPEERRVKSKIANGGISISEVFAKINKMGK